VPNRRFQTGCLRRETKSWILYFRADVQGDDGIIRRRPRCLKVGPNTLSKAEAKKAAQPLLESINEGGVIVAGTTLRDFIPEWRDVVAPTLKPSTVKGMESSLRAHILPQLGDVLLSNIDARQIQGLVNTMRMPAKKSKQNVVGDLLSILSAARSPQWGHKVPRVDEETLFISGRGPREAFSFTPEHVRAILKELAGTKWELFFITLALTGLRAGEILGLRVVDCDMTRRLIFVEQTAWEGLIIDGAKTEASKNSVPMQSLVWEMLVKNPPKGELLFPNRKGGPYRRGKIVENVLHPVMEKLGIPYKGKRAAFHAFRHALSSMLVNVTNPAVAQRQLRHKDASITLGIYSHVIGTAHIDAVEEIQRYVTLGE
jgi:integrase